MFVTSIAVRYLLIVLAFFAEPESKLRESKLHEFTGKSSISPTATR